MSLLLVQVSFGCTTKFAIEIIWPIEKDGCRFQFSAMKSRIDRLTARSSRRTALSVKISECLFCLPSKCPLRVFCRQIFHLTKVHLHAQKTLRQTSATGVPLSACRTV